MTKTFTYIELFAGIGGFRQALYQLGGQCVFASEIDKHAKQSYEALYGDEAHLHGDITKITAEDIPTHDLLVGGFPCQAFSTAGKRLGFEDTRGTLFFEALRIAKHHRPKALLLENVKGLVNHANGDTISVMLHALNDVGYTVDFSILNSKYFGVPQNRERVFIVAIRDDLVEVAPWVNVKGTQMMPKAKKRLQDEGIRSFNFNYPEQKEVVARLRDILELEVDENYYLSEDKTEKLVAQLEGGLAIREATSKGYAVAAEGDAVNYQFPNSETRRGRVGKQLANTLEASGVNQGVVVAEEVRPVLTPDRMEKRQNGRRFKDNDEEAFTLTAQDKHGVVIGEPTRYRIRKLTPLETWRLQGFSDEAHEIVKQAGASDSQRYKQSGNAVTVNVIRAIGERLLPYLDADNAVQDEEKGGAHPPHLTLNPIDGI